MNCSTCLTGAALIDYVGADGIASLRVSRLCFRFMRQKKHRDAFQFFQRLGTSVEDAWRRRNYESTVFPEIAADALEKYSPGQHVDPFDAIRHLAGNHALPKQWDMEGEFSNLPITLFNGPRFYIDIYFWLDGTTTIHQHGFAGAFQVLSGSSLHSHYEFLPTRIVSPHFAVGKLSLQKAQVLSQGTIKRIIPGSNYIHCLFHLERPSTTITIRTPGLPNAQPQFHYLSPGVAFDPFFKESTFYKKVQSADLLLRMRHPEAESILAQMIRESDLHTAFMLLGNAFGHYHRNPIEQHLGLKTGIERFQKLQTAARNHHGESIDVFYEVFNEGERQRKLVERRGYVTDEELRFFLALLLNVWGREQILKLVRQRFPTESPAEKVLMWIEELSQIRVLGTSESNALGIDAFDDLHLLVTECLMRRKSLAQTQRKVSKVFSRQRSNDLQQQTKGIYESLRDRSILAPIFAD